MNKFNKKVIKESCIIIIIAAIIGFSVNLFHPKGFVLIGRSVLQNKKMIYISPKEAKIKYDSNAIFIDSRDEEEYKVSHIKNSINIPSSPESLSLKKLELNFSILNMPRDMVIYCDGASCGSSEILAKRIIGLGYSRHIYLIKDGFPNWVSHGYPVQGK